MMKSVQRLLAVFLIVTPTLLVAQTRSMAQDPALNNFQHPPGVQTGAAGTLGRVRKVGTGPRTMLLIPGLGFGDGIWTEFMERHRADYTMYAIALPGFGDTPPLPMPAEGSRFADAAWTRSTIQAIERLLTTERIERVTVVAHWALASQIALQLALDHPDQIDAVILVSGVLKSYYSSTPRMMDWSPDQRARSTQEFGEKWFKTVTRHTWDDNNYMPWDYAINPLRGLFLWREAQAPLLSVWVRYLLEFYTFDQTSRLTDLRVPTLVVQPTFDDPAYYLDAGRNYMRDLCVDSWRGARDINSRLEFVTVPESRLFIIYDRPEALDRALDAFLRRTQK
jgi:pimeloyl-ACP methyl ester carboxylesterase